jgi:hypothetical protein
MTQPPPLLRLAATATVSIATANERRDPFQTDA